MKNPRSQFIEKILEFNDIPSTYVNAKGKVAKTITGHDEGLRFVSPHRIKFEPGSGIVDIVALKKALSNLGVTNIVPTKASGAKVDTNNGFLVEWKGTKFVVLLKGNIAKGQVRRKQTTPADIGLAGKQFKTAKSLYQAIIAGISNLDTDVDVKNTLVDLVDSVYNNKNFTVSESLTSSNFIQSDFGETLVALHCAKNKDVVCFPDNSNNDGYDFYRNEIGCSVKAPNGDHLNLRSYKDRITGTTPIELFFKACATSDYELLFRSLSTDSGICQDLYHWVEKVAKVKKNATVTIADIRTFMSKVLYTEFLDWLKAKQPDRRTLGVPTDRKMHIAQDLWNKQDLNPFMFAYITLAQKIWGVEHTKEISDFAKSVLKQDTGTFITVNINLDSTRVEFTEQSFTSVSNWGIWYLGYCDQAVKNWPGICRVKETND
jgi:hypothetical protein